MMRMLAGSCAAHEVLAFAVSPFPELQFAVKPIFPYKLLSPIGPHYRLGLDIAPSVLKFFVYIGLFKHGDTSSRCAAIEVKQARTQTCFFGVCGSLDVSYAML